MASKKLSEWVALGLQLYKNLTDVQEHLKYVEEQIVTIAQNRSDEHQPLADDEREGRRFFAKSGDGPDDPIVPVVFTADKLISSFKPGSPEHQRLEEATGGKIALLFTKETMFKRAARDGKTFRSQVRKNFGQDADDVIIAARDLDENSLPKNDIKVEWKDAATETEIAAGARKKKSRKKGAVA